MIGVLHSSGMDSTAVLLWYLQKKKKVQPIFIDYGQKAAKKEWAATQKIAHLLKLPKPVRCVSKVNIEDWKHIMMNKTASKKKDYEEYFYQEFFPNRNTFLLSVASMYCAQHHIHQLALGIIDGGDSCYSDTNKTFVRKINTLFNHTLQINVKAPLIEWDKKRVADFLSEMKFPIHYTYSCNISNVPCGLCASCIDRATTLKNSK
ncbi:MAG: 7-cyano-7-deazaguanine synthase [Chitinophagaceae bacterium]